MSNTNEKIVIKRKDLKVKDETFIPTKLAYKMTIHQSKKQYNRKKIKNKLELE